MPAAIGFFTTAAVVPRAERALKLEVWYREGRGKTVSIVRTIILGENDESIAEVSTDHVAAR